MILMAGYLLFDAFTLNWQKALFDTKPKVSKYQVGFQNWNQFFRILELIISDDVWCQLLLCNLLCGFTDRTRNSLVFSEIWSRTCRFHSWCIPIVIIWSYRTNIHLFDDREIRTDSFCSDYDYSTGENGIWRSVRRAGETLSLTFSSKVSKTNCWVLNPWKRK